MRDQKIISTLAAATVAVMGSNFAKAQMGEEDLLGGDFRGSLLYYTEQDRVTALEAIVDSRFRLGERDNLRVKLTVDSLTGASASGAVASDFAQTFTTPSGNDFYTTGAGDTPLDDTFLDTRYALAPTWTRVWNRNYKTDIGINFSKEYDYTSLVANALLSFTTNDANTIYTGGFTFGQDTIEPEGGIPTAFGLMQPRGGIQPRDGADDTKTTFDALFGVTQVIDSKSLFQLNYSLSAADGYLNDPFKLISVVGADGRPVVQPGGISRVVFENRPDTRTKHSLYAQYKRDLFDGDVLDASYRFMFDDWGINSHTLDLKYKFRLDEQSYLQPHLRIYQQSEADFYTPFIPLGSEPAAGSGGHASADYRLGEMTSFTFGLEYGRDNVEYPWSIALEYYLQDLGDVGGAFGELSNQELNEDVSAIMVRFNIDF